MITSQSVSGGGLAWTLLGSTTGANNRTHVYGAYSAAPIVNATITGANGVSIPALTSVWLGVQAWTGTQPSVAAATGSVAVLGWSTSGSVSSPYPGPSLTTVAANSIIATGFYADSNGVFSGADLVVSTNTTGGMLDNSTYQVAAGYTMATTTPGTYQQQLSYNLGNPTYAGISVEIKAAAPPPTITSLSPSSGTVLGGTSTTITGTDFVSGATVTIGGNAATGVSFVNSTTITCATPPHAAGTVDVVATNPDGQSATATGAFEYIPVGVTSVEASIGSIAGGTAVTVTGVSLTGASGVTFGGAAATDFIAVDDTTITATTPAHTAGAVDVVVTVSGIDGTLAGGFTYVAPPTIPPPTTGSGRQFMARSTVTGSTDYGLDVSTVRGLDPTFTLIGERRAIAEVYARMLQTPRGSMFYSPSRGTDVRAWLNARVKDANALDRWRREIEAEGEQDERIESASATLTWNQKTGALRISVAVESAAGPFTMVLAVTALTISILEVQ